MHKIFMFYLDLDEIDLLCEKLHWMGHNKANVYNFCDDDHFKADGQGIKAKVMTFLASKGIFLNDGKIMLLTNLRTFGYTFNPVSFYFCFDNKGNPQCVVPEIGNTFGEIKPYLISREAFNSGQFSSQQEKYFYISPFIAPDIPMDFHIGIPDEKLNIKIDDFDKEGKFLYTVMSGKKKEITNGSLFWVTLKYPLITLKVIFLIHFHAFLLWFKRVPYYKKTSNPHLQKEVYRVWNKNKKKFNGTYA